MGKYFFESNEHGSCLTTCQVHRDGTKIGSVVCQRCKFCVSKDDVDQYSAPSWIICSKIDEADTTRVTTK